MNFCLLSMLYILFEYNSTGNLYKNLFKDAGFLEYECILLCTYCPNLFSCNSVQQTAHNAEDHSLVP